jgi:CMP-N-acetylneuraminic acid synthetase
MWDLINLSIENALNSGVDNIVISGDFNENLLNPNKTKLANIILQNGLYQTITEPT